MRRQIASLALVLATTSLPALAQSSDVKVSDAEREKIEAVIESYLMENPELIVRSISEWQRRRQTEQMLPTVGLYRGYLENDPSIPVLGNPKGDVTIVEFYDYRCGYCRRHYPVMKDILAKDGNVRLTALQFPILDRDGETPMSRILSRAALASNLQGKFEPFHDALMTAPKAPASEKEMLAIAERVGLDTTRLQADMKSPLIDKAIENALAIGRDIGFEGTPGYIIGNDILLGAEGPDRVRQAIARARADKAKAGN